MLHVQSINFIKNFCKLLQREICAQMHGQKSDDKILSAITVCWILFPKYNMLKEKQDRFIILE